MDVSLKRKSRIPEALCNPLLTIPSTKIARFIKEYVSKRGETYGISDPEKEASGILTAVQTQIDALGEAGEDDLQFVEVRVSGPDLYFGIGTDPIADDELPSTDWNKQRQIHCRLGEVASGCADKEPAEQK